MDTTEQQKKPESKSWTKFKAFWKALWKNTIWPALQDLIAGIVGKTTNKIVYGLEPDAIRGRNATANDRQSNVPWNRDRPSYNKNNPSQNVPRVYKTAGPDVGVDNISSCERALLENIMARARNKLASDGNVSLNDLYYFGGLSSKASDCNQGLHSLEGMRIVYNASSEDYTLEIPTVTEL